jgi:hypothetical protein
VFKEFKEFKEEEAESRTQEDLGWFELQAVMTILPSVLNSMATFGGGSIPILLLELL